MRGELTDNPGYLYLAERLPPGHELHLMLINTIRKVSLRVYLPADTQDLASTSEAHILAALHVIAHLPSPDLAPAVVPLLTSKRLLEHPV
jgi:AP-4 complex subunit epsilon-1